MMTDSNQSPPISTEDLMEVCARFMDAESYLGLANSTLDPEGPEAPGICREYRHWERSLRNDLTVLRANAQSLDPGGYLRPAASVFGTESTAHEVMGISSPLEAELYLDACRWAKIDELAYGHFFDLEFLRGYKMKLEILERHDMFEEEKGFDAYREIYARVLSASGTEIPMGV
jgi:hypothetical protein